MRRHDSWRTWCAAGFFCAAALTLGARADEANATDRTIDSWRLFPGHTSDLRFYFFGNTGEGFDRDRYVSELDVATRFVVLDLGRRNALAWDLGIQTGMGKSLDSNLPFALNEISYNLGPSWEFTGDRHLLRAGWDHTCNHLVHKDVANPWYEGTNGDLLIGDVYYNRLFIGFGNPAIRPQTYRRDGYPASRRAGRRTGPNLWYAEGGAYLRHFPGIDNPDSLYKGNDWQWDLRLDLRRPIWVGRHAIWLIGNEACVLVDTSGSLFLRDHLGLDLWLADGGYGTGLFVRYTPKDSHPRDSREHLVEFGLKVFL